MLVCLCLLQLLWGRILDILTILHLLLLLLLLLAHILLLLLLLLLRYAAVLWYGGLAGLRCDELLLLLHALSPDPAQVGLAEELLAGQLSALLEERVQVDRFVLRGDHSPLQVVECIVNGVHLPHQCGHLGGQIVIR